MISFVQNQGSERLSNLLKVTQLVGEPGTDSMASTITLVCLASHHTPGWVLLPPHTEINVSFAQVGHCLSLPLDRSFCGVRDRIFLVLPPCPCTANPHSYVSDEEMAGWKDCRKSWGGVEGRSGRDVDLAGGWQDLGAHKGAGIASAPPPAAARGSLIPRRPPDHALQQVPPPGFPGV